MTTDANWLRHRIEELEGAIRQARWQLGEIAHARGDAAPVWNDRCATDVATRYLGPLASGAADALDGLQEQATLLHACADALGAAGAEFEKASDAAREVERLIGVTETVFRTLDSILDTVLARVEESAAHTASARGHLESAAAVGGA